MNRNQNEMVWNSNKLDVCRHTSSPANHQSSNCDRIQFPQRTAATVIIFSSHNTIKFRTPMPKSKRPITRTKERNTHIDQHYDRRLRSIIFVLHLFCMWFRFATKLRIPKFKNILHSMLPLVYYHVTHRGWNPWHIAKQFCVEQWMVKLFPESAIK